MTEPAPRAKSRSSVSLSLILFLPIFLVTGWCRGREMAFDRECAGHLKRAGDANSVELAESELRTALAYIERHGMTEGYTSFFYTSPENDMGFWYRNLKGALADLEALPKEAPGLEKSNMLLKLRETLLDHEAKGEHVTAPDNLPVYPYLRLFMAALLVAGLLAAAGTAQMGFAFLGMRMSVLALFAVFTAAGIAFAGSLLYALFS